MLYGGAENNTTLTITTFAPMSVLRALVVGTVNTSARSTDIAAEVVIVSVVLISAPPYSI